MPCIEVARGTNGLRESRPMDQESFSTSLSGAILSPIHLGLGFDPSGAPTAQGMAAVEEPPLRGFRCTVFLLQVPGLRIKGA